jgi:hypothetical protein
MMSILIRSKNEDSKYSDAAILARVYALILSWPDPQDNAKEEPVVDTAGNGKDEMSGTLEIDPSSNYCSPRKEAPMT